MGWKKGLRSGGQPKHKHHQKYSACAGIRLDGRKKCLFYDTFKMFSRILDEFLLETFSIALHSLENIMYYIIVNLMDM